MSIMFYLVLNVWLGLGSCTFIEETLNCWTFLISHLKWVSTYTHLPVYKACFGNKRLRENEKSTKNLLKSDKSLKIDPEGTHGPIGLIFVSFFSSCLWHLDSIKKIVKKVILTCI